MDRIEWHVSVPIFRNTLILQQLGFAIGIPFGLVAIVVVLVSGQSVYALYGLFLIVLLLFLSWLFVMLVYRGRYDVEYVLDRAGVRCRTQMRQAKTNRLVNRLTVVLGLFSGNPSIAGAGLLAQSRQDVHLRWSQIIRAKCRPKRSYILLRGGFAETMALFCTAENYEQVAQLVVENASVKCK